MTPQKTKCESWDLASVTWASCLVADCPEHRKKHYFLKSVWRLQSNTQITQLHNYKKQENDYKSAILYAKSRIIPKTGFAAIDLE